MNAKQILAIKPSEAKSFFPGDAADVKKAFHKLVRIWHPDQSDDPKAEDVLEHLVVLKERAMNFGKKSRGPVSVFARKDGTRFSMSPVSIRRTDAGDIYVGSKTITTVFDKDYADIADLEEKMMGSFKFADAKMKDQMGPTVPNLMERRDLLGGKSMLIQERKPGQVLLRDLIEKDGYMPPKHAAWLCSGLMNICAWLTWSGRVHGAISPNNILVNPDTHLVRLVGGWGFSVARGERPVMLPERTMKIAPYMSQKTSTSEPKLDLELVRQTVREAMGAPATSMLGSLDLPEPILSWLTHPPAKDGIADYENWQKALSDGWGPRVFMQYPVSAADIYG